MELENFGPGSHLISFSYLAFPLARLSISDAFGGSRLSLSLGENELSWKLHYSPCLMRTNFSHTAISPLKTIRNAQWNVWCSSPSVWHSFSQLSAELSLCDNSRPGLCLCTREDVRGTISGTFMEKYSDLHESSILMPLYLHLEGK